jgi:hypothetical protein
MEEAVYLNEECAAEEFLHGGEHHDDTTRAFRKQFTRRRKNETFPRDKLLDVVDKGGHRRPTPKRWQK